MADVSYDINTQEIKQMFHNALTEVPMTVIPLKNITTTIQSSDSDQLVSEQNDDIKSIKSNYLMGKFLLDPISTDFIGIFYNILVVFVIYCELNNYFIAIFSNSKATYCTDNTKY